MQQSFNLTQVFVLPPQESGLGEQTVWKLRVAVYRLADASRQWDQTVKRMLTERGMEEVTGEPSLFYSLDEEKHINCVLAAHVDDFLYGEATIFITNLNDSELQFEWGLHNETRLFFVDFKSITKYGIHGTAKDSDNLTKAVLNRVDLEGELNVQEERWVRSLIGTLQWSASTHRPDLSYHLAIALGNLNSHRHKFSIREANGLIDRYQAKFDMQLIIKPLGINWEMEVFGDSAFKHSNQQGIVACLRKTGATEMNVVPWKSKKAERKSWSTLAAETHVLQVAMDKARHLNHLLSELRVHPIKVTVVTDNLSLRRCLYSGRPTKEERLRKEFAVLRDMMNTHDIRVRFVPGQVMLAECLTKVLSKENTLVTTMKEGHFPSLAEYDAEEFRWKELRNLSTCSCIQSIVSQ